jgi:hypothetical protein
MTTSMNGRADIVGSPIELGDFLPEKRVVKLNGQSYEAWVTTNRRYPRRIQSQLDRYSGRYQRVVDALKQEDIESYEREALVEQADEAYQTFVSDSIMALVPGLPEQDVDLIDIDSAVRLLRELGYFKMPDASEVAERKEDGDQDPLTGDTSPEDSPASTPDIPTTAS